MIDLADRALRKLRELQFNRDARAVLATPPIRTADDGVVLFSMIGTRVLLPYLIAAKSLYAQLGRGRFVILDDGTLTAEDRATLAAHLDRPEILAIGDVELGDCPRGGCWERLLTLLALRRDNYVIQLDSDTVTLGPVPDVVAAIGSGRDFTLLGGIDAELVAVKTIAAPLSSVAVDAHVQAKIEVLLAKVAERLPQLSHYVRGCAGFAGFAPGGMGREVADAFSREAIALLGKNVWSEWGSEQVMSNVIVANEGAPVLLPYDRYLNFWNEPFADDAALVHFVGTYRYHRGAYARASRQAMAGLGAIRAAA
ncbi:MAG: hypothetical protein ACKOPM_05865 [Novosphingobium sp.]